MDAQTFEPKTPAQHAFHFGHLGLVLAVAVSLGLVSWMKNPSLFSFKQNSPTVDLVNVPRYYAYVPPPEDTAPLVAGASTNNGGPSIINEDGSVSPVVNVGEVLGVSTEDINYDLNSVTVQQIPDTQEAIQNYLSASQNIEANYLDNAEFEAALTSGSQEQIDTQTKKIESIKNELDKLPVPTSLVQLHKLKIVQYNAGREILKNYTQAEQDPELVIKHLGIFLQAQQSLENEALKLQDKLNLNEP